ncbi:pyrroline-5-carboxylate reductase [Novosphingobium sp. Chol11]|uniref:pyrroline-5-carboxylate reductase family protein n=1 Tax=Novosphingobium sp. Chol11 TaxID=1385763 RepID=UPI0025E208F8|nr:pyrroline-5-carboxylate reductase [Novosphingobium sp. Chol11]
MIQPGSVLQFGCGNMGGAMLTGWLAGGFAPAAFTVVDPFLASAPPGVRLLREGPIGEAPAQVVMLGFKPQQLADAAAAVGLHVGPQTLVLSILAGADLGTLRGYFPGAAAIVRVMPNLAAALGKSPIALFGDAAVEARQLTERLMAPLGIAEWLADEADMDLVTALAGSGPAFVYRFIDALAEAAAKLGLPRAQADRLALSMVEGAAALAAASPHAPGELARRVASPGGVTQVGIDVLDAERRLVRLMEDTLRGARDRSAEMTALARKD